MSYNNYGGDIKMLIKIKEFKNQTELFPGIPLQHFGKFSFKNASWQLQDSNESNNHTYRKIDNSSDTFIEQLLRADVLLDNLCLLIHSFIYSTSF